MTSRLNTFEVWRGKSLLDLETDIVCLLTKESRNKKTGDMMQTWILRQDVSPAEAVKSGQDSAICGGCIHRLLRSCYVQVERAPLAVWKRWKAGHVPRFWDHLHRFIPKRKLRIGAYGDPAAVPVEVWHSLLPHTAGHTGYTHHWAMEPRLAEFCMASVEDEKSAEQARKLGYRTFRVMPAGHERIHHLEALCPASKEAGHKLMCLFCMACGGTKGKPAGTGSIAIPVHGPQHKKDAFYKFTAEYLSNE